MADKSDEILDQRCCEQSQINLDQTESRKNTNGEIPRNKSMYLTENADPTTGSALRIYNEGENALNARLDLNELSGAINKIYDDDLQEKLTAEEQQLTEEQLLDAEMAEIQAFHKKCLEEKDVSDHTFDYAYFDEEELYCPSDSGDDYYLNESAEFEDVLNDDEDANK